MARIKSNKLVWKIVNILMLTALLIISFNYVGYASSNDGMRFNIAIKQPEGFSGKDRGYFELNTDPKLVYDLTVEVVNNSSQDLKIEVTTGNASTTSSGSIDYCNYFETDESLKYPITDYIEFENSIDIPANTIKDYSFKVSAPEKIFPGSIVGAINFRDITDELKHHDLDNESANIEILNQYQYTVPIVIKSNGWEKEVLPDYELVGIEPVLNVNRAAIVVNVRNRAPILAGDIIFNGEIKQENTDITVFSVENKEIEMAPNSLMGYSFVDEEGYGLLPGDYIFNGNLTHRDETWEFEQKFKIEKKDATDINRNSTNQQFKIEKSTNLRIGIMVLVAIIILGILILIILKYKTKKE